MTDHPEIEAYAKTIIGSLALAIPQATDAFFKLAQVTFTEGALSVTMKELIALSISVSQGCEGCMAWHNAALHRMGASREQIAEAIAVAVEMGGGIALYNGAKALAGFDQFAAADKAG